jgi:cytochrome c oxidase assembly protein subunit 15
VTSHGAGLAVPDWPTTYGEHLFLFPVSKWVGGIFYEHTHRLLASAVGLMTLILATWLWLQEDRRWLRRLGVAAVGGVILQGVLGGLRVTQLSDELGIVHAALGQMFLVLVGGIALFTSRAWAGLQRGGAADTERFAARYVLITAVIFAQLLLGAAMRHQHAGLAIPDFPLAYGRLWPDTSPEAVALYNQTRTEVVAVNPITAPGIGLQMAHRLVAMALLALVAWAVSFTGRRLGPRSPVTKLTSALAGLVFVQALLGALTIWTNKSPAIATAHVAVGALTLLTGALLSLVAHRTLGPVLTGFARRQPESRHMSSSRPPARQPA